jgi:hypothetical protein
MTRRAKGADTGRPSDGAPAGPGPGAPVPVPGGPIGTAPRWAVLPAQVPLEETWVVVPVDPPVSLDPGAVIPLAGGALATDDD